MDSGGIGGLEMRFAFFHSTSRVHHAPAAMPTISRVNVANPEARWSRSPPSHPFESSQEVKRKSVPSRHSAICAYNHAFKRRGVPILINTIPRSAPAASEVQPRRANRKSRRSNGTAKKKRRHVKMIPSATWNKYTTEQEMVAEGYPYR